MLGCWVLAVLLVGVLGASGVAGVLAEILGCLEPSAMLECLVPDGVLAGGAWVLVVCAGVLAGVLRCWQWCWGAGY